MCEERMQAAISDFDELAGLGPIRQLNGGALQWFALVVKPRFDKAVARALEMKGYETLLPLYKKHHKYGARSKSSELPLFPGYVCCRFDVHSRLPVLTTPGVIQVLGAGNMPIPVSDGEINSLEDGDRRRAPNPTLCFRKRWRESPNQQRSSGGHRRDRPENKAEPPVNSIGDSAPAIRRVGNRSRSSRRLRRSG